MNISLKRKLKRWLRVMNSIQQERYELYRQYAELQIKYESALKKEYPCTRCNTTGKISYEDYYGSTVSYACNDCEGNGYVLPEGEEL